LRILINILSKVKRNSKTYTFKDISK